jgi:hypothetical protein
VQQPTARREPTLGRRNSLPNEKLSIALSETWLARRQARPVFIVPIAQA